MRFFPVNSSKGTIMPQTNKLLDWYENNKRDLPWRHTNDPYKIWLSEVILQQTRVDQGMEYYLDFVDTFPTVKHLASANEDLVLKQWQGLGYYSRARNLHEAAKMVVKECDGRFPDNFEDIKKLKGVGPYTAAAIASIVFNEPRPVVDGNVMRVVSRWFAIKEPINTAKGRNKIEAALDELIDKEQPGKFNQAIMEFGALFCKPKNPDCRHCIFNDTCEAFMKGLVAELPRKTPMAKIRNRYFNYLFMVSNQNETDFTVLKKRSGNDIWQGLYEFPLIETESEEPFDRLTEIPLLEVLTGNIPFTIQKVSKIYIHQLSHQKIHARFIMMNVSELPKTLPEGYQKIKLTAIHKYPVSRLVHKFLEDQGI